MGEEVPKSSLSVMLIVSDATSAVQWYMRALGADLLWDLGGVAVFISRGRHSSCTRPSRGEPASRALDEVGMTTTRIEVFVDDPGALIDRASAGGATDVEPLTARDAPWGIHQQGGFTDPYGHRWSVGDRSPLISLAG